MDGKLCPGIQPPPLEIFTPLQGKPPPPLIQKFFNPRPLWPGQSITSESYEWEAYYLTIQDLGCQNESLL